MNINIKSTTLEDSTSLTQICKIDEQIFGKTKGIEYIKNRTKTYPNRHLCLAEQDNQIVGYSIGYTEKNKYYLWMMGVLPKFRGQKVGNQLLNNQIEYAKSTDHKAFFVKTSNQWKTMLHLLLKNDFDIVGYKSNEWGDKSAIWLEKKL